MLNLSLWISLIDLFMYELLNFFFQFWVFISEYLWIGVLTSGAVFDGNLPVLWTVLNSLRCESLNGNVPERQTVLQMTYLCNCYEFMMASDFELFHLYVGQKSKYFKVIDRYNNKSNIYGIEDNIACHCQNI